MQVYRTIAAPASARLVEKKSEFIAVASPAQSEEHALALLETARNAHRAARHTAWAFALQENARARYSDDGEPAKTAGLPILEAIQYAALSDVIVTVTRYFGGTLLGTGGLVRAYGGAAGAALAAATVVTVRPCVRLVLTLEYPLYEPVRRILETAHAKLDTPEFGQRVALTAVLPAGNEAPLVAAIQELSRGTAEFDVSEEFYCAF